MMTSKEIRKKYLDFFEEKGHKVVASDLLVPRNDPTLLFTGAGMNQFKEQFMGRNITFKRAASSQKCLRTGDLENVGKTPRHHTFFEMLGNFSFGDYFKSEAIKWAWEFMTEVMGIPEERLWISVYKGDDEAYAIWRDEVKVPEEKIIKLGEHDNFWPADAPTKGPNGPCGPCSEIFYDWGEGVGCGKKTCDPSCDCGRFVEVWNLVFTEFERKPDGTLEALPNKNIDTGMGLERMVSVIQGVKTNFETDLFVPLIKKIEEGLGKRKSGVPREDIFLIADHVRAAAFAIADGVSPSNERRGYVVRKLIRRAYLKSGSTEPFLFNLVPVVTEMFKDVYPELFEKREHICAIIEEEEKRFNDTLASAMPILEDMLEKLKKSKGKVLFAEDAFLLVDTYGLPVEVIDVTTTTMGLDVDLKGFEELMEQRKDQSRKGSDITGDFIFQPDAFVGAPEPEFSEDIPLKASIAFILKDGEKVDEISEGDRAEIITSPQSTWFYAEAGGQVGDTGHVVKENAKMHVLNTYLTENKKVLEVIVKSGSFSIDDTVTLKIDESRKHRTAKNHTATHLLQAALRQVLGDHVKQSGSLVDSKRLRFDFTHMKKLSDREIRKVQDIVNEWIKESIPVYKEVKTLEEAQEEGALSFFGEKYGEKVRVVSVGEESKELCGGTHVDNTGDIKLMKIINESAVASGIRRIDALTGDEVEAWLKRAAQEHLNGYEALVKKLRGSVEVEKEVPGLANAVKTAGDIAEGKAEISKDIMDEFEDKIVPAFLEAKEFAEKKIKKLKKEKEAGAFDGLRKIIDKVLEDKISVGGIDFVSHVFSDADVALLRKTAGYLEKKTDSGIILVGGSKEGKATLICAVTKDLTDKDMSAKAIIDNIAGLIDGGGGGRPEFAQAGGKNPRGLQRAIEEAKKVIEGMAKK